MTKAMFALSAVMALTACAHRVPEYVPEAYVGGSMEQRASGSRPVDFYDEAQAAINAGHAADTQRTQQIQAEFNNRVGYPGTPFHR
jgi:hypothetical protein